jgi:hypothetical protein
MKTPELEYLGVTPPPFHEYSPIPSEVSSPTSSLPCNDDETECDDVGAFDEEDVLTSQNLYLRHQVTLLESEISYLNTKLDQQRDIMHQLQSTALLTHEIPHPPKPYHEVWTMTLT